MTKHTVLTIVHKQQRRSGQLSDLRAFTILYTLLIAHVTLYPYFEWRNLGVGPWEYWFTPWIPNNQRFLITDTLFNLVAYIPFGSVIVFTLPEKLRRRFLGALFSLILCSGFSATLEAIQTFLPTRVPSKMDWAANSLGALIGICLSQSIARIILRINRLTQRPNILNDEAPNYLIITLIIWFFCLLSPQPLPYVLGPWLGDIWLFFLKLIHQESNLKTTLWLSDYEEIAQTLATSLCLLSALCLGIAKMPAGIARLYCFVVISSLALLIGWLGPQSLNWLQGNNLIAPWHRWSQITLLALVAATLTGLCLALSNLSSTALARISLSSYIIGYSNTLFLPGYKELMLHPQHVASQMVLEHIVLAANWLGTLWPAILIFSAWQLCNHRCKNK